MIQPKYFWHSLIGIEKLVQNKFIVPWKRANFGRGSKFVLYCVDRSIGMNSRATHLKFACPRMSYLRMLLAFSQPVNCIFWPIKTQNWLVAASKLHNHWGTGCTAEWPYCPFVILWCRRSQITIILDHTYQ